MARLQFQNLDIKLTGLIVFARLLELSDEQALRALAVVAGEALVAGSGLAERLGELLRIDMRACWRPDDAYLLHDFAPEHEKLLSLANP